VSANNPDARTRCSEILCNLILVERFALKSVSNGEPAPSHLLVKFKALGLIKHNGKRIALTEDGWMVLRLCHYASATPAM
jgi:hypothetical protein